jgi:hypothetical protein
MIRKSIRELIWVPILHTQADMGSVSDSLKSLYSQRLGKREWERHVEVVADMWRGIPDKIEQLDLDYGRLRLYQDGLPNCGREREIVRDLAEAGSQNHHLLIDLMERGAELTGTESPDLLLKEYELVQETLESLQSGDSDSLGEAHRNRREALLRERDRYIAKRIDETLHQGETGLIFLGLLHSLHDDLPQDIQLVSLDRVDRARKDR